MVTHKIPRQKGKFSFRQYFQVFKPGDIVAVVRELSHKFNYSHRVQGRTGRVIAKRGEAYEVEVADLNNPKRYMLRPIHLKRIKS